MYKEIFKNGVNEESLKAAGEYALVKVMSRIRYNEIRWNQLIINEFGIKLKESLKIKPIVKVPTAELHTIHKDDSRCIVGYPTKSDSYDSVNPVKFLNDEIGHCPDPKLVNYIQDQDNFYKWGISQAGVPSYRGGIDTYDINDKESKGSLASNCDKMLEDLWLKELTKNK